MAFTDKQTKALKSKLSYRYVKSRRQNGATLNYIEGWHAIGEANRIFGFDSWDRQTMAPQCLWSEKQRGQLACLYSTKVRITVRAGGTVTVRDGIGTGFGRAEAAEAAHEIALKAAETDATKRALATFGNPFGLALYDKDMAHVTRPPAAVVQSEQRAPGPLVLTLGEGPARDYDTAEAFVEATLNAIPKLTTISEVYAFWEANLSSFTALRARAPSPEQDPVPTIVSILKSRARMLGRDAEAKAETAELEHDPPRTKKRSEARPAIPKERRVRDADHLAFVARHPCLVCGRRPTQAHHIRFAQPRAMGLKVSDEYTVPLCNGHHDGVHRTGDERAWWAARHIDPLAVAARLWATTDKSEEIALERTTPPTSQTPEILGVNGRGVE